MLVLQQTLLLLWFCSNAHHGSVISCDGIQGHGGRLKLLRFAVGRGTLIISREGACVCEHHSKRRCGRGQGLSGGWGVTPTWKSFRFVGACARSGCQVEFDLKSREGLFPFPFCPAEVSLFHCVAGRFPFSTCEIEVKSKGNRSEFEVKSK